MKENRIKNLTHAALIGAIYVVLTLLFRPISYGSIQLRISEALCVLPYFTPAAIPGLFIGCLISNLLGGAVLLDVVFGSLATLLGALGSRLLRKYRWLVPIPPILANVLIIPWVLKFAYASEGMIWYMMVTIGIGEILAVGVMGQFLMAVLGRYRNSIFGENETT